MAEVDGEVSGDSKVMKYISQHEEYDPHLFALSDKIWNDKIFNKKN